ncbi:vitellogenin-like [Homarus americanus]|uniref:vitellogenin-like n=1 Tax=Homarus americanus TaxID=6706 RepID=UPI001C463777|nr:vitellogenin-like [Homarus americanus]
MKVVVLTLILAALARADDPVCALTCISAGDGQGVQYEPGMQYKYKYEGQVMSKTLVTDSDDSRMSVKADVIITANTLCDLKLQVVNFGVEDVSDEESRWFREAVEQHDLHFNYQEGRIAHLCPHPDEDVVATNFKRGVLSALHITITDITSLKEVVVDEGDVSGVCETRYSVNPEDFFVEKTKHNCRSNGYLPNLPHSRYSTQDFKLQLPFFRRDQSCQMIYGDRVWKRVECKEEVRVDGPFTASREDISLASVTVSATLMLEAGPEASQGDFSTGDCLQRREPLLMDLEGAVHSERSREHDGVNIRDQIDSALENLFASMAGDSDLEEQRPHAFSNLVSLLGHSELEEEMDQLWDTYDAKEGYRQVKWFRDRPSKISEQSERTLHYLASLIGVKKKSSYVQYYSPMLA